MKVRIKSEDGQPKNTVVTDAVTGEMIQRIQEITIHTHVDKPLATATILLKPLELDMIAYVDRIKLGYTWYYPSEQFVVAKEYEGLGEEWEEATEKIDGLEITYSVVKDTEEDRKITFLPLSELLPKDVKPARPLNYFELSEKDKEKYD